MQIYCSIVSSIVYVHNEKQTTTMARNEAREPLYEALYNIA